MLQRSHILCTCWRSSILPDTSPAQCSTVGTRHLHRSGGLIALDLLTPFIVGTIIVLFFQCMIALFDPAYRRGNGVKWGLGSYTVVMFSLATISTGMNLNILSVSYIDNREYPTGPFGYAGSVLGSKAINVVPNAAVFLGGWLADGLLVRTSFGYVFTSSDIQ